ncbi:MAG: substrate-binding domain-containing protein [Nitrospirota bacterium]
MGQRIAFPRPERTTTGHRCAFVLVPLLLLSLLLFSPNGSDAAETLTASGCSVSNVGYLTDLAKEYERRTGIKVLVRGGGSAVGIEDLRSAKVDFAAACRSRSAGDPEDVAFIQVAWDALVFIVHPSNPLSSLSLDNVRSIYAGGTTNWQQLKGPSSTIKVFISRARQGLSGVEASTNALVLKGREPVETPHTLFLASTAIVEQMVESTPEGFATTGYTSARKRRVKMLKIDGVAPSVGNIIQQRYPLKRPLFILLPKHPKPAARQFVDFVLSKDGQQYLRSLNVVSLLDVH